MTDTTTTIDDGGMAFPQPGIVAWDKELQQFRCYNPINGMSLRDYFAAAALTGLLAKGFTHVANCADLAFEYAEAMIQARKTS